MTSRPWSEPPSSSSVPPKGDAPHPLGPPGRRGVGPGGKRGGVSAEAAPVAPVAPPGAPRARSRGELRMELAAEALIELDPGCEISCAFQEFLGEEAVPGMLAALHAGEAVGAQAMRAWMMEQAVAWLGRESRLAQVHWAHCAF